MSIRLWAKGDLLCILWISYLYDTNIDPRRYIALTNLPDHG